MCIRDRPVEVVCNYCHLRNSHYSHQCPQKFVDSKPGLKEQYLQRYREKGETCVICKQPGHEAKHHGLAQEEVLKKAREQGKNAGNGGGKGGGTQQQGGNDPKNSTSKGKGREGKGKGQPSPPPPPAVPDGYVRCRYGPKCWSAMKEGKCDNYHPKDEWSTLMKTYQEKKSAEKQGGQENSKGKGKDKGKKKNKGKEEQRPPIPPEVAQVGETNQQPAAKAQPKMSTGRKGPKGTDVQAAIEEEIASLAEKVAHFRSRVPRTPGTGVG